MERRWRFWRRERSSPSSPTTTRGGPRARVRDVPHHVRIVDLREEARLAAEAVDEQRIGVHGARGASPRRSRPDRTRHGSARRSAFQGEARPMGSRPTSVVGGYTERGRGRPARSTLHEAARWCRLVAGCLVVLREGRSGPAACSRANTSWRSSSVAERRARCGPRSTSSRSAASPSRCCSIRSREPRSACSGRRDGALRHRAVDVYDVRRGGRARRTGSICERVPMAPHEVAPIGRDVAARSPSRRKRHRSPRSQAREHLLHRVGERGPVVKVGGSSRSSPTTGKTPRRLPIRSAAGSTAAPISGRSA